MSEVRGVRRVKTSHPANVQSVLHGLVPGLSRCWWTLLSAHISGLSSGLLDDTGRYSAVVHATRTGRWWSITIDEDPRAQTQARRLDQVEDVARSVLIDTDMLSPTESATFTVITRADSLDELRRAAVDAKEVANEVASKAAREFARRAADQGLPLRDIGAMLGVTHQSAQQLLTSA